MERASEIRHADWLRHGKLYYWQQVFLAHNEIGAVSIVYAKCFSLDAATS